MSSVHDVSEYELTLRGYHLRSTKKNLGCTWTNFVRGKMNLDKMQMSRFGKMDVQVRTGFVPVGQS
jgi:hypothetical protein